MNKQDIINAISEIKDSEGSKSLVDNGNVKNLQIFNNEIILDIQISNPSLHYKKQITDQCITLIHQKVSENASVKINFLVKSDEKKDSRIRGKKIPGIKHIVGVSSAKGGVGKSTITANLAISLSNIGYKVGVLDADIYGPSQHIMFGLEKQVPSSVNIDGSIKIRPIENYGVKMISIGFFAQAQQAVVWRGPMASKALNQMIWDSYWQELDYLLVDLPPGTGDIHLSLVQSIPVTGIVMITTPQEVALSDVRKGANMFQMESIGVPILGIVENMSYFEDTNNIKHYIFGKGGGADLSKELDVKLLAEIPLLEKIRSSSDLGTPVALSSDNNISDIFLNLSHNIVKEIDVRESTLPETEAVKITHSKGCI